MVIVAICSNGIMVSLLLTAIGRRSMFSALIRSSGCKRTATSLASPVGSTQSPTSTPAKATRKACAASFTEIPNELARPRLSSICNSSFGSCCDRPTSTAPLTLRSLSINSFAIVRSLRASGPEKLICTGFPPPLPKSS